MIVMRLRRPAIAFVVFAVLFMIAGCSGTSRSLTVLSVASGSISVTKTGSTSPVQAGVGTTLKPGDIVQANDNSTAVIAFFEGSTIELKAGTRIEVVSLDTARSGSTTILLNQMLGETISRVTKLADLKSRYEIETPAVVAAVRGSVMLVAVETDGTTRVGNLEGKISVVAQGVEVVVPVGGSSIVRPGESPKLELSYDDGAPNGGYSTGVPGREYGYMVRFSPPALPFEISKVRMLTWMPGTPGESSQFTVRITDKDLNLLWGVSLPLTMFTADTMAAAEHSWLEVVVPGVTVNSDFWVQLYAPTLGQGLGPYIGTDTSSINEHSEMILGWQVTEWVGQMPEEKTNWMIRVEGIIQ
jgi:hypothetical protein